MTTTPAHADLQRLLQLLDPANRADPYGIYAQFRDLGPVQLPEANMVVFSSYRDCDEVLRHPSSSSAFMNSTAMKRRIEAGMAQRRQFPPGFLFLDPPDHTRLRKLVSKAFAPKVVNALQPDIAGLVDGLLDAIAEKGRCNVVEDFAHPLPVAVICRLLGVPLEDEPRVQPRVGGVGAGAGPVLDHHRGAAGRGAGTDAGNRAAARVLPQHDRPAPVAARRRSVVGPDRGGGVR